MTLPTSSTFREVDRLLRRGGLSVRQISNQTGVTWWRVYKYARRHGIALWTKRPALTTGQQAEAARLVEVDGLTMAAAARQIGASEMQVWRVLVRRRDEALARAGEFRPKRLRHGRRCPRHGIVHVWPCVACHAMAKANPKPSQTLPTPPQAKR